MVCQQNHLLTMVGNHILLQLNVFHYEETNSMTLKLVFHELLNNSPEE
jgi:hypothetical protein